MRRTEMTLTTAQAEALKSYDWPGNVRELQNCIERAIIERERMGGTCVNVGCTPTKALVASARVAHMARRAAEFGIDVGETVRVDMARVNHRMKRISGESERGVTKWLEGLDNVDLVRGHARFV